MATWAELAQQRPDFAEAGRRLLYQHGVGLAFLATIRKDTGPRLHPICPLLTEDGLFAFIIPSPKQQDLLRDGRFAMHSFPCPDNEDAFYLTGRARLVNARETREQLARQFVEERSQFGAAPPDAQTCCSSSRPSRAWLRRRPATATSTPSTSCRGRRKTAEGGAAVSCWDPPPSE